MSEHSPKPQESVHEAIGIVEAALDGDHSFEDAVVLDAMRLVLATARYAEDRRRENMRLSDMIELDDLTMTFNRRGFMHRLDNALTYMETGNRSTDPQALVVVLLDGDNFKAVNDQHGHPTGDELLWAIGARLWMSVRSGDGDTVGRLGGDEFALLLPVHIAADEGIDEAAMAVMTGLATRLDRAVSDYNESGDAVAPMSLSKGAVIVHRGEWATSANVMERADRALYEAKRRERGSFVADIGAAETNPA